MTGRIYISGDHGTAYVAAGDPPPSWATPSAPKLPAPSASKAEWVDYATRTGIEGAASMTKAEIIADATEPAEQE